MTVLATIEPTPVPAGEPPWAIAEESAGAVLRQSFGGASVEYRLPGGGRPAIAGNEALIPLGPWGVARWASYTDHVKFEVVFARRPPQPRLPIPIKLAGLRPDAKLGEVDLVDGDGIVQATVLRPWLRDATGQIHDLDWKVTGGALLVELPDLPDELWRGAVLDPTTVQGSIGVVNPTQSNAQKKIAIADNGVLWVAWDDGSVVRFEFSTDGGQTFADGGTFASGITGSNTVDQPSIFIDDDGFIHAVYHAGSGDNSIQVGAYRRGTFNAARTSITWSAPTQLLEWVDGELDLVVHREGTGWVAHIAGVSVGGTKPVGTFHQTLTISSAGAVANGTRTTLSNSRTACAVDFKHNGNGRTKSGNPDVFVVYLASLAVHARKLTYSSGSWTLGAERTLIASAATYLSAFFDGTRLVVLSRSGVNVLGAERDAADTTTTVRNPPALTANSVENVAASFDQNGNIYCFASEAGNRFPRWVKYTRSAGTWGAWTTIESAIIRSNSLSTKPGYHSGSAVQAIDVLYTRGLSTPVEVVFDRTVTLNVAPTAATWVTAGQQAADVAAALLLDWTFNDPDPGDSQGAYALRRQIGTGAHRWWRASDSTWQTAEVKNLVTATQVTLPAGWGADSDADHKYAVKTWDSGQTAGVYSAELVVTPSAKVNPTITDPSAGAVVASAALTVKWAVASQSAYQVRLLSAGGGQLWTSGWVSSASARARTADHTLANATNYSVEVTTRNAEGLASTPAAHAFSVSFTPPPQPTVTLTPDPSQALITVAVANGATGASIVTNDIYRRMQGETDWQRIATGIPKNGSFQDRSAASATTYEYLARAVADNTSSSDSAPAAASVTFDDWWLKDPLEPARDTIVRVRPGWAPTRPVRAGVFHPRGRTKAVVASGEIQGISASLPVRVLDAASYAALEVLLTSKRTLLLQNVVGQQWYVRVVGDISQALLRARPTVGEPYPIRHAHEMSVPIVEVAELWAGL